MKNARPRVTFHSQGIFVSQKRKTTFLTVVLLVCSFVLIVHAQSKPTAHIAWARQPGVATYRLQIANDEAFTDILFDSLITGTEYVVQELAVGKYFYRVAPAGTGSTRFQKATPFEVRVPVQVSTPKPVVTPALPKPTPTVPPPDTSVRIRHALPGWSVATGEIVRLVAAQLRNNAPRDFLGVNSQGKVYALDGARGIALWTAPFNVTAPGDERVRSLYNNFAPVLVDSRYGPRVIVAFDKGIRALDGATGKEVWTTRIAGRPPSAALINSDLYLVGEKTDKLFVLDSNSGQLKSQIELRDDAVGPPVLLANSNEPQLLVPLKEGLIELVTLEGKYLRSIKLGTEVTAQPRVVVTPKRSIVLLGLKNGLVAFDAVTVEGLGRIAIEGGDYPVGELSVVDLNGDGFAEAIMTTNTGRVICVDVNDGKINWTTDAGKGSSAPAFADLDGDAKLDVLLPAVSKFAVGVSGLNGNVIWDSGDEATLTNTQLSRSVAVATVQDGRLMLVATDQAAAGLRAFEVQRSTSRSTP